MFKKDFEKSYNKEFLLFSRNQNFNHTEINNKIKEYENYNPFLQTYTGTNLSLTDYFSKEINNTTKQSTKTTNKYVLNSLKEFRKVVYFEDLNLDFMSAYKNFLTHKRTSKPLKNSTIKKYITVIKTICNNAKRQGYKINESTFDFKIGKDERINNKVLTKEDIEIVNNISKDQKYFVEKNLFLFSLYGQGLRISDSLFIKAENFKNSHIEIGMTKTKNNIHIQYSDKIMDVLMDVLDAPNPIKKFKLQNAKIYLIQQTEETLTERYSGDTKKKKQVQKEILNNLLKNKYEEFNVKENILKTIRDNYKPNDFIFKGLLNEYYCKNSNKVEIDYDAWKSSQNAIKGFNQRLKVMAKLYKLSVGDNISSHSARYTFVNLLLEKNTNIYLISKALGHSSLGITERYIKRNFGAERLNITQTLSNIFD
nr:site-specific integrase [Flavobacterium sp.]